MPILLAIAWMFLVVAALAAAYWAVVWLRVAQLVRRPPTVREGLALSEQASETPWPKLSVIIPVHNEERVIEGCCQSLRSQEYPDIEFVFVLDRCTDTTADILRRHAAEDARLVLIENGTCPPDWAGKCHAARLGAQRASGEYLIFADADTSFDPALCRAAMAIMRVRQLGLLSLLSTLTFEHDFERTAQPVATMHLMRLYPLTRQRSEKPTRPFANGQFMLFSREWYDRLGGHEAVKDDLLEDLALAKRLQQQGGQGAVLLADGMLRCSMYDSFEGFRTGWKRIFIEACRRSPQRLRKHAWRVLFTGLGFPLAQLGALITASALLWLGAFGFAAALIAVAVGGWVMQLLTLRRIYRLGGAPESAAIMYPLGCWIVARAMLEGAGDLAQRRPVRWGGREYILQPRGTAEIKTGS